LIKRKSHFAHLRELRKYAKMALKIIYGGFLNQGRLHADVFFLLLFIPQIRGVLPFGFEV
jgi:hypothetical protein